MFIMLANMTKGQIMH